MVNAKDTQAEIRSSSGPVVVERSAIAIIRSEAEQQLYESTLNPGLLQQWTGGADFGLALTRGNSHTTNLALGMAISRETLRDKASLYSAAVYNRETSDDVSRTLFALALAMIETLIAIGSATVSPTSSITGFRVWTCVGYSAVVLVITRSAGSARSSICLAGWT